MSENNIAVVLCVMVGLLIIAMIAMTIHNSKKPILVHLPSSNMEAKEPEKKEEATNENK